MKIKHIVMIIIIGMIVILGIYFLSSKNDSHPSNSPTSTVKELPNSIPNDHPATSKSKRSLDPFWQKEEKKEQIKQIKADKIRDLQQRMGFDEELDELDIIYKKSDLKYQIDDIKLREIPHANIDIEGNQTKIGRRDANKQKYLKKPQTSENLTKINQLDQEIKTFNTNIQNIQAKISEKQQTLIQLEAELQKLTAYETELKQIEAECQQQIQALEDQYK